MALCTDLAVASLGIVLAMGCGQTSNSGGFGSGDGERDGGSGAESVGGGQVAGAAEDFARAGGTHAGGAGPTSGGGTWASASDGTSASVASGATDAGSTALSTIDPHAAERRRLAAAFCGLLDQYPCLELGSGPTISGSQTWTEADRCLWGIETDQFAYDPSCWDAWVNLTECSLTAPRACPCIGNDCALAPPGTVIAGNSAGEACADEVSVLSSCSTGTAGDAIGSAGTCHYVISETLGCYVRCTDDSVGEFEPDCQGPLGGAQACTCQLNGVTLCDDAAAAPDGCSPWYADDCIAVAQTMADGLCRHMVDCCFTWTADDGTSRCSCTADPTVAGFDSCEAAAQAGGGAVVDLCPRYQPARWDFPQP